MHWPQRDGLIRPHPDGRFSLEDAVQIATSPLIVGDDPAPSEDEVRTLLKTWQWCRIVAQAPKDGFLFRRTNGSTV